jgi:hypothetical protein
MPVSTPTRWMAAPLVGALFTVACAVAGPPGDLGPCSVFIGCPKGQICVQGGCGLRERYVGAACDSKTVCPDTLRCQCPVEESCTTRTDSSGASSTSCTCPEQELCTE